MTWAKLDDQFPSHPKIVRVGPEAAWLHVCAICYCARYLTDGFVPKEAVPTLSTLRQPLRLADRLVEERVWRDRGDQYELHDFLDYNPSREHVENERRLARERRGNGARGSPDVRANVADPVPDPDVHAERKTRRKPARSVPDKFELTDERLEWVNNAVPGLDPFAATQEWLTACKAKDLRYADWEAAWHNAMRRAARWHRTEQVKR